MRRRRWAIGLGAAGLVLAATACHVPYDVVGPKGADVMWVTSSAPAGTMTWWVAGSTEPFLVTSVDDGAEPIVGDWDGNGRWEPAVLQPPGVVSSTGTVVDFMPVVPPGGPVPNPCGSTTIPITGSWDADKATDLGWFAPSAAWWQLDGAPAVTFGRPLVDRAQCDTTFAFDVPVPADYDGDGTTDIAVYEVDTGLWKVHGQLDPIADLGVGVGIPAPADYDGDGDDDPALWVEATATLHIAGQDPIEWLDVGPGMVLPTPADYDGDGDDDPSVWAPLRPGEPCCGFLGTHHVWGRDAVPTPAGSRQVIPRPWISAYAVPLNYAAFS